MDKNKMIILALIVVIIALLAAVVALMPSNANKQESVLTFESNSTIAEGDSIKIKLTDVNGTAIVNQNVSITITDKNDSNSYYSVVTDENGTGKLKLDNGAGKYDVTISYGGNDDYNGCNITKELTIEEKVEEVQYSSSSSSSQPKTYASGLTDSEIEAYIQRDIDERTQNGVDTPYDYQGAREFYENVPPTGME